MLNVTYVGTQYPELTGKTAIARKHRSGLEKKPLLLQFNDTSLGPWCYGWWDFDAEDVQLIRGPHQNLNGPWGPRTRETVKAKKVITQRPSLETLVARIKALR